MTERLDASEEDALIELTQDLIRIPSSLKDGNEIYNHAADYLRERGFDPGFQTIESPYMDYFDFSNLYLKIGNGKGPKIMLNGHLDTVVASDGWLHPPDYAFEEGDRIYGLGAADMKGGCAAIIQALIALVERKEEINGEVFLSCVFGEEAPFSLGTDTLLREHDLSDYDLIMVTEPSPLLAVHDHCYTHRKIHRSRFPVCIVGAEGRVLFEVEFFGRSAHASHPSQGHNALHDASRFISKLAEFDMYSSIKMGRGHYCVLNIDGGGQSFTVPDHCKVMVNRQLTLGEDERSTTEEMRRIVSNLRLRSKVVIKRRFQPGPDLSYMPYIFENGTLIDRFMDRLPKRRDGRCKFTTSSVGDFNLFATRTGVPTLVFGPGGGNIHAANEFVSKKELIGTANYILDFLMEVM